ncbi:hypothetical protein MIC448_320014 [Microbacterium sp. C448]|uniref:hypothetical protein n=1 Tax=Microbacterium sp. C448 TaxID=1177594 RepID=UPI0003DE4C81|nr:hypothetical protein [Microbacterium sp. C448]CDK00710.1 hypothetical protein MIC448_320014 [Microbacterium sp. C448]
MIGDEIDRDFEGVDPEAMREPAALLDEVTLQALSALERREESTAPLLCVLVDVARLRLSEGVSRG